ncbi:hypothetical protein B2J93_8527 [Marssonina coronariae]|uniref:Succinate dehydrogenase assembly factor 2, mitochondrial n=1 Tax=Diplocarpon coronariae TaxID=2795749 RepID=A0A218ZEG7_9HELO|nr:hypothetical protein B2J93_8527 [Marssonina coronariae]
MSSIRLAIRTVRPSIVGVRPISSTSCLLAGPGKAQEHEGSADHRKIQTERKLNPHMTNTNSTISNAMPSIGARKAPPELLSSVEPDFVPMDSIPENTKRMTGGTQEQPQSGPNADMGVGELEGAKFKVEPLRRTGEDPNTTRARLLYQCRKRGTLESDLLMSTFAEAHLREMTAAQMAQLDMFLDENDWDIYYWATQEPTPTSQETAEGAGAGPQGASANAAGRNPVAPQSGEWAQTVGTFKPAYRPVPARWRNSEILAMLRRHVISRSAGGVHAADAGVKGDGLAQSVPGTGGKGMAFMPPVFNTHQ